MSKPEVYKSTYSKGVWFVQGQEWRVGERYELLKLVGSGSFSSVCLANDSLTGEKVAIKKVGDVLSSPEQAKKVLREICILRRLRFPFLIALYDAFVRPSSCGPCKLIGGELVPSSIDVYIVMEYGEEGDLFNLRGQLTASEVRVLTWQLLQALKFLHANNVWHRDIKSANILLKRDARGQRIIKVADFGSARSATQEGYHWAEQGPPEPRNAQYTGPNSLHSLTAANYSQISQDVFGHLDSFHGRSPMGSRIQKPLYHVDSFAQDMNRVRKSDLYVKLGPETSHTGKYGDKTRGFAPPLTRTVATPCYRAPEVVMSRGGYTSAIDMWSAGCILGELLQRIATVGSATTPHLQVAPLFAIHGMPKTPGENDTYAGEGTAGNSTTRSELMALFDVIGTPCWADVETVQSRAWRHYLRELPGRAPTLYRRLGFAGEVTVNLLERLLTFDPARRCTAEEALAHEYLDGIRSRVVLNLAESLADTETALQDMELDDPREGEENKRPRSASFNGNLPNPFEQAAKKFCSEADHPFLGEMPTTPKRVEEGVAAMEVRERHYWEENDPATALAMLEDEMADIRLSTDATSTDSECRACEGMSRLRRLLEDECTAQAEQGTKMVMKLRELRGRVPMPLYSKMYSPSNPNFLAAWGGSTVGLREDRQGTEPEDSAELGRERLNYVADRWKGKLDPAEHLMPGRHGEWTSAMGNGSMDPPSMAWGVTVLPPGKTDPNMQDAIRRQQAR